MAMALDLLDKGEDKDVTIYRKCKAANGEDTPRPTQIASCGGFGRRPNDAASKPDRT